MNLKLTSYEESEGKIRSIRDTVFGQEQKVPREINWDGNDPDCIHIVALDKDDKPIGTGRIQADGKIGRLAVLKDWRNRGFGGKMLETLVESACSQGLKQVHLHAQVHAILFYEKRGFEKDGEEFMEAGIRHINMTRSTKSIPEHHA